MTNHNPVSEARRYLDNARAILREKAMKEKDLYQDPKYVKMAGHTAYAGVLVALDHVFKPKKKGRNDVTWYKDQLGQIDRKALNQFSSAYDILHLLMGYDGNRETAVAQIGLKRADEIIRWVEQLTAGR